MEDPCPFVQHPDTNYVPNSEELDEVKVLIAARHIAIDAIDAEIAELEKKKMAHAQYAERLRALTTPVRRLPDDILLTIFFESLGSAEPWSTLHPSVVASHVCRRWRGLALGTPLLWKKIEIRFTLDGIWNRVYKLKTTPAGPPHAEIRPYIKPYLSLCRRSLRPLAERVRTFAQRSSGCPLQLQASSGLGMQNATLRVHTSSPIPEARWNAVLPEGKIDLGFAKLHSSSIRMAYADMCRVQTTWDGLTTLTFCSLFTLSGFLPQEAFNILRSTPYLIHCTIYLSFPTPDETAPLHSLILSHLKFLTIIGDIPPRAFAAALHLPVLTRLWTDGATALAQGGDASAVYPWIGRYGAWLTEVSIAHSSLTKPALGAALRNLPNVESLKLNFNPKEGPLALVNMGMGITADETNILKALNPGYARGYPFTKMRTVNLKLWGGNEETMVAIVDLVEKRRGTDRASSIARLDTLDINFRVPLERNILLDLERKGVDTDGVSIRTDPKPSTAGWE